jgi:hypothetical protein
VQDGSVCSYVFELSCMDLHHHVNSDDSSEIPVAIIVGAPSRKALLLNLVTKNTSPSICAGGFYVEYAFLPTDPLQHEGRAVVVAAEPKLYACTHKYGAGDGLLTGVLLRIERVDAIHCSRIQAA